MSLNQDLKISIKAPLHELDTEQQTYGCRCNNPDICNNCGKNTCAFYNDSHLCLTPSRAWKKIYLEKKSVK